MATAMPSASTTRVWITPLHAPTAFRPLRPRASAHTHQPLDVQLHEPDLMPWILVPRLPRPLPALARIHPPPSGQPHRLPTSAAWHTAPRLIRSLSTSHPRHRPCRHISRSVSKRNPAMICSSPMTHRRNPTANRSSQASRLVNIPNNSLPRMR